MCNPNPKGRGAGTNASGRYETHTRHAEPDGWEGAEEDLSPLRTEVTHEAARTIISRNQSPDISFDQSINPYRGCEHGCFYCYARPNHAYVGLSPGLDFETKLFVKTNAAALLEQELRAPNYLCKVMVLGGVTDVYQPIERTHRVTRAVLEVLRRFSNPVALVTKSQLVTRDIDILAPMAARNLARVAISVTSLDPNLARKMEPRAAAPHRRLAAMRALTQAGVPVAAMVAPIIPTLNDHEIEAILEAVVEAGAKQAGYVILRLPRELKDIARDWFETHAPDRARHILSVLRQMRGGRDYDPEWFTRQRGQGPYARLIADRFRAACARLGLNKPSPSLDTSLFARPVEPGDQLNLL